MLYVFPLTSDSPEAQSMPLTDLVAKIVDGAAAVLVAGLPAGAEAHATAPAQPAVLSTADYLEMPEIFQITVVSGSIAVLQRFGTGNSDKSNCDCLARWSVSEDVVAVVALHVQRHPDVLDTPFADTLVAALSDRCRAPD
jgi:hypothetical protein